MLTHQNHANDDFETPVEAVRHKDGSIDYAFYDRRARTSRSISFRAAARSVVGFMVTVLGPKSDKSATQTGTGNLAAADTFLTPANTADPKAA